MKLIKILAAAVFLFATTQAHAYVLDLSQFNGGTYSNVNTLNFMGSVDFVQEMTNGEVAVGGEFSLSNVLMTNVGYMVSGIKKAQPMGSDYGMLSITGSVTGHVTQLLGASSFRYVYDTVDLSLYYGATITPGDSANNWTQTVTGGTKVADTSWFSSIVRGGELDLYGTGTFNILAGLTNVLKEVFFVGKNDLSAVKSTAYTKGYITPQDGEVVVASASEYMVTGAGISGNLMVATPEPASMLLLGSGLLGLYAVRRRKTN